MLMRFFENMLMIYVSTAVRVENPTVTVIVLLDMKVSNIKVFIKPNVTHWTYIGEKFVKSTFFFDATAVLIPPCEGLFVCFSPLFGHQLHFFHHTEIC